ncbi:MAG: sensor histidine kinase [bacterium]|nr:sensor histidine kinase [bacterium]
MRASGAAYWNHDRDARGTAPAAGPRRPAAGGAGAAEPARERHQVQPARGPGDPHARPRRCRRPRAPVGGRHRPRHRRSRYSHIFERFYTGDASRTRKGGAPAHLQYSSGLGLAIAAKVVAAHGDELQVTSRPGEGAEFRFHLAAAVDQGLASLAAEG